MFLEVTPKPKERPRLGRRGIVYTPLKTQIAEREIAYLVSMEMNKRGIDKSLGALEVHLTFHYVRQAKFGPKTTKPDLDNMVKLTMDALTGIAYKDDCQISKMVCEKLYSDKEGIELRIIELD